MSAVLLFSLVLQISCGDEPSASVAAVPTEYELSNGVSLDTLSKWKLHAESSDEGLWEGDSTHYLLFDRVSVLGGEEDITPPFYYALYFHVTGDTILLADRSTQELVCMLSSGEILWKAGESGEGPGHFHGIGTIASDSDWISVANTGLGRVDFFSREGVCTHTQSIEKPEDLIKLTDSTLVVLSGTQPGGLVHILHVDSGLVRSFGEIECDSRMTFDFSFKDNLRGVLLSPDLLAVISRYEHRLFIFNLETEELIFDGRRNLPSEPAEPYRDYNKETGMMSTVMFPSIGGVFSGPEGMVNIVVDEYQSDGSLLNSNRYMDYPPLTVIDRYNHDGEYLDSYCLPDSGVSWIRLFPDGKYIGRQQSTGILIIYKQICTDDVQY